MAAGRIGNDALLPFVEMDENDRNEEN